jgi:hypothetical protein
MNFTKLIENSNLDNLYCKPECHEVSEVFDIQEYRSRRHIIVEVKGHMVR